MYIEIIKKHYAILKARRHKLKCGDPVVWEEGRGFRLATIYDNQWFGRVGETIQAEEPKQLIVFKNMEIKDNRRNDIILKVLLCHEKIYLTGGLYNERNN